MAVIRCKMCGGDLVIEEGSSVAVCEYCGTKQTVPTADNEKKLTLFGRANRLLRNCEFDKASGIYESIVAEFPEEAEAYWCLVLCKYGIEYVDDPATGKKVPTCHRSSFESVLEDKDVELAMEYADIIARRVYRDEAKQIEELRKAIIEVSGKEEPYDVFISYKETDENGDRTLDSVIAQDIYDALTDKGYRVFFSRISLADKLGTEYEPYIFAALNSAKVMLCVGTDYEHFNAVWVKNEWSRFLSLIAKGEKKVLIPVFKNIDAYDMPKEFAKLSAQDMGKVGAMQDLLRGVDKIIGKKQETAPAAAPQQVVQTIVQNASSVTTSSLLKRGFLFLEDGNWKSADEYLDRVLDIDPENALAYLGKIMVELGVSERGKLKDQKEPFDASSHYRKAMRFADEALKAELEGDNRYIRDRNSAVVYDRGCAAMISAKNEVDFKVAAEIFVQVSGYADADERAEKCLAEAENARMEEIYRRALDAKTKAANIEMFVFASRLFDQISGYKDADTQKKSCLEGIETLRKNEIYRRADAAPHWSLEGNRKAIKLFQSISGWRDADEKIKEREQFVARIEAREEAQRIEAERRRREKISALTKEKANLRAELPNLQGIFKSSRRKEAETRLAEIEKELNKIRGEI